MEFIKNLGVQKFSFLIASLLVFVLLLAFFIYKFSSPIMMPLYSNLNLEDTSLVISKLQQMDITYEAGGDGAQIFVPSKDVFKARMALAQDGIPNSGSVVGYEIFDKSEPLGVSQFVQNVNLIRALEGELARTISGMTNIEHARVHLVLPKRDPFSTTESEPSASVVIKQKRSSSLGSKEVAGIAHLVATAVPSLNLDNITIVDSFGRPLKIANSKEDKSSLNSSASDYQLNLEKKLSSEVTELLERYVGIGKTKVSVSAEIDFDREMVNIETYDPNGQVLRSKKTMEESEKESQDASTLNIESNITPNTGANQGVIPKRDRNKTDEVNNYEISKTISNKVIEGGHIKKLSVAIIVDGQYKDNEAGVQVYTPRSAEDITQLKNLVSSAIGFNSGRGDVIEIVNLQFSHEFSSNQKEPGTFDLIFGDIQYIIQTCVLGIVSVLVIMLVVRPISLKILEMVKEKQEYEQKTREASMAAARAADEESKLKSEKAVEDVGEFITEEKRRTALIKRLNDIIDTNPEEAVATIRSWLYQDT